MEYLRTQPQAGVPEEHNSPHRAHPRAVGVSHPRARVTRLFARLESLWSGTGFDEKAGAARYGIASPSMAGREDTINGAFSRFGERPGHLHTESGWPGFDQIRHLRRKTYEPALYGGRQGSCGFCRSAAAAADTVEEIVRPLHEQHDHVGRLAEERIDERQA